MTSINNNPIRQIGIISDPQQGQINAILPLPGQHDGLISVAKDLSLRIWMRRENSGQYYPTACYYLGAEGTCLYLDKSGMHLIVGAIDGSVYRYKIENNYNIMNLEKKYHAHNCAVKKVLGDFTTVYHKDYETNLHLNAKLNLENTLVLTLVRRQRQNHNLVQCQNRAKIGLVLQITR